MPPQESSSIPQLDIAAALDNLHFEERRNILSTINKLRDNGLDSLLSRPQLLISGGDHSTVDRNSASETFSQTLVPRSESGHSPFATEIVLRQGQTQSIIVRIIPDITRPQPERKSIANFHHSTTDLTQLPEILSAAMSVLPDPSSPSQPNSKDTLRIEVEGPSQPQLTLVDLPRLIDSLSRSDIQRNHGYHHTAYSLADETTATSTAAAPTPTETITPFEYPFPVPSLHTGVPVPGSTFLIRALHTHQVLTLSEGHLHLEPQPPPAGGWHWACIERDGWLGFRNCVSGTFMGHDGKGGFHAKVTHHKCNEWFVTRAVPGGGHLILILHGDKWRRMGVAEGGREVLEVEKAGTEGTVWEFVKV
ncbi:hypothetical protein CJF31_00011245 [Rutstroemia sp. NJR-2017a BVV2]|nr:hypothetical protein CJF31_00011245 [Rutstroemia sp. NJR-2017a BVV2]